MAADQGRSGYRAHQKAIKTQNAEYLDRLRAIRDRFPVGTVVNFDFLSNNFPQQFPKGRPHFAEVFIRVAKKKEHLDASGKLLPSGLVRQDILISDSPQTDQISGKVIRRDEYPKYAWAFYTEGKPFERWRRFTAKNLGEFRPSFAGCDPASVGEFLVWLRDRDRKDGRMKKAELAKNGEWSLTQEGLWVQADRRNATAKAVAVAVATPAPPAAKPVFKPAVAAPVVIPVALMAPTPPAVVDVEVIEKEDDEIVVATESVAVDEFGRKPRKLPQIGIGPIPTGKNFNTKDRRALGMLILSVVKVAGGAGCTTHSAQLFPKVRELCELGSEVRNTTVGMFFRTLWNFALVESAGDSDGFSFLVKPEVYARVLEGEFGELPLERFGLAVQKQSEGGLTMTKPVEIPSTLTGFFPGAGNCGRALGVLLHLAGQEGWVPAVQFARGIREEFVWPSDRPAAHNIGRALQGWAAHYAELETQGLGSEGNLAYRITTNGCEFLGVEAPSWAVTYNYDGDKPQFVEVPASPPASPEPVLEPSKPELDTSVPEVREKRAPNAWDLRRHEKTDRQFARLVRICDREGIIVLNATTARRVYKEFDEASSGILLTKIYTQAKHGRILQFVDQETKAWNFWFKDDFLKAVRAGRYDEVPVDLESLVNATTSLPVDEAAPAPAAPPEPIIEPVSQATPEPVQPSGSTRQVVRHRGQVPLEQYEEAIEQLRASRVAVEKLQATITELPDQIRKIVEDALRRQAEGFTAQVTELRDRVVAAEARMDKHILK